MPFERAPTGSPRQGLVRRRRRVFPASVPGKGRSSRDQSSSLPIKSWAEETTISVPSGVDGHTRTLWWYPSGPGRMAQSPGELWRGTALLPSPPPPTTMLTAPSTTTMRYKLIGVSAYNLNVERVDQQWEMAMESPILFLFAEPFHQRLLRFQQRRGFWL